MLATQYQQFIHLSKYARWDDEKGRRETWPETVGRYFDFMVDHIRTRHGLDLDLPLLFLSDSDVPARTVLESAVRHLKALPSMRALMTAGPALARDHIAGYNCAYRAIDSLRAFDEILYILMCGTGVGFSVERQFVSKLPSVPHKMVKSSTVIKVMDSKRGWAEAFHELMALLYSGRVPSWDVSEVRPAGARLVTFGGRASGPAPLVELFEFAVSLVSKAAGRKLNSLECHDLVCKIGDVVVVGGVRRAALLSLSNLSDERMRDAKSGEWFKLEPQRQLANNSVAYTERPEVGVFMKEWLALYQSKSGERGMFNRVAAIRQAGSNGRRVTTDQETGEPYEYGTNPCSEIILRNMEFCNLTTVVARAEDTLESLEEKVVIAATLGTLQSTLTDFTYIGEEWKANCEDERLLGVSMTGIMDCPLLNGTKPGLETRLEHLKSVAVATNKVLAELLGIKQSAAVTCVKPEGTASQLTGTSSGLHAGHSPFYGRAVRMDKKDSMTRFMLARGFPNEDELYHPEQMSVFTFPVRLPEGAICRDDRTAIEELEMWLRYQRSWCEHKPSITVTVREHEWIGVGAWVWEHFDEMSGVAFLPHSDHVYKQAPYQEMSETEYRELLARMPAGVDWLELQQFELEDETKATQELACVSGVCEVIGLDAKRA